MKDKQEYEVVDFDISYHEQVYKLAEKAWLYAYSSYLKKEEIKEIVKAWYSEENHKGIYQNVKAGKYYFKIALNDKKQIVGFISGTIENGNLDRLYIKPELIGKGLGSFLFKVFIEELKGNKINQCKVSCDKHNQIGLEFYKRKEFKIISEDEDDYTLILDLNGKKSSDLTTVST